MHAIFDSIPMSLVTTLHIIGCASLIFFVLIQDAKGGGAFGGSSQSILGPTGAPTLFAKVTRYMAILFATTSIVLTVKTSPSNRSATDSYVAPAAAPAPTTPPAEATQPAEPSKKDK